MKASRKRSVACAGKAAFKADEIKPAPRSQERPLLRRSVRRLGCSLLVAFGLGACATISPLQISLTERNRATITAFADQLYAKKDVRGAFERYVVPDYIQHNPGIADGRDAAVAALAPMFSRPGSRFEVKRIIVDGDLALIHLHGRGDPGTPGAAVADIYRLRDGQIVEHWDVIQAIPDKSANPHPMF